MSKNFAHVLTPYANYIPYKIVNKIVYISGQLPIDEKGEIIRGRVCKDADFILAKEAARLCSLRILSHLFLACKQDFNNVEQGISLRGFVACDPFFTDLSTIIDAASETIISVLGDSGQHTRTVVGASSLPKGSIVEIEAQFTLW